jgi:glycosyltransferase involved in cell wall biosynthesis
MAKDSRVRLIQHAHNSGTHIARITGVENSRGEFIMSLDPDDTMLPHIAKDSLMAAIIHNVDMVEFLALNAMDETVRLFSYQSPPYIYSDGLTLARLFARHQLNWNLWKRLIRRSVYLKAIQALPNQIRHRRVIYAEDKLHIGVIFLFLKKFYFLKELGYVYYRDNPDNSVSGKLQTKREAWRQLRFVENGLKHLYAHLGNLTYWKTMEAPEGLLQPGVN